MKVQLDGKDVHITIAVNDDSDLILPDLLQYIDQAIKGLGYVPNGELQYELPLHVIPVEDVEEIDNTDLD